MAKLRVFLADDHAVVREGLKALVNAQPAMAVVGEAADGLTACARVALLAPDVVVMDVSMPGLSGSQATARLRLECPAVRMVGRMASRYFCTNSKPKRPLMQRFPFVTEESVGESTFTMRLSCTVSESTQPTPQ